MQTDQQNIFDATSIFENGFLHGKALYMCCFNAIPSENFIPDIDGEKAFYAIKEKFDANIKSIHAYRHYDQKLKTYHFLLNTGVVCKAGETSVELSSFYFHSLSLAHAICYRRNKGTVCFKL